MKRVRCALNRNRAHAAKFATMSSVSDDEVEMAVDITELKKMKVML